MGLLDKLFGSSEAAVNQSKIGWRPLTDGGQLNEIIHESTVKPVAIFKHSTRCGISRMTLKQFEGEFDLEDKVTPYFLDLLEHRAVSDAVASRFGVEHQSPQLLLISNGKTIFDASHGDINAEDLKRYI